MLFLGKILAHVNIEKRPSDFAVNDSNNKSNPRLFWTSDKKFYCRVCNGGKGAWWAPYNKSSRPHTSTHDITTKFSSKLLHIMRWNYKLCSF